MSPVGQVHSGACRGKHNGDLGPTLSLVNIDDAKIEIRRLKSAMINAAAFLACELHDDDMTERQANRLYDNVVMKLKSAALD